MDLLVRYGFSEIRDEISWSSVETTKGNLSMPDYGETFVSAAAERHIRPLLIFDYGNPAYDAGGFPNSPEAIAAYANYCASLARFTEGRVDTFEVWNEWSIGCGMSGRPGENTPAFYAAMLQAAYAAVKSIDPTITIVGIGGEHSEHHFENIKSMIQNGGAKSMDAFSVHSYRYPRSPEQTDLVGEIKRVREMSAAHGGPSKVWVTEIGWPTQRDARGVDGRRQARYLVRTMALLHSTSVVEKVHWYDFKDDGTDRDYNEHNFGVVGHQTYNYAPKPAAVAASVFARMTADATPNEFQSDKGVYSVPYQKRNGDELVVVWTVAAESRVRLEGKNLRSWDIMGNLQETAMNMTVSSSPIYVVGNDVRITPQ
jgi:hypothetical protein